MSLDALVRAHFSEAQQTQLGDAAIAAAIANALNAYSDSNPRLLNEQVSVSNNAAPLPDQWEAGFSEIIDLQVIEAAPAAPAAGEDGVTIPFTFGQWQLINGNYYIDLVHGLGSTSLFVTAYEDSGERTDFGRIEPLSSDTVRVWVSYEPDARFAGNALLERA